MHLQAWLALAKKLHVSLSVNCPLFTLTRETRLRMNDINELAIDKELVCKNSKWRPCCDPMRWPHRYSMLFLLCYIHAAVMFSIENIGGLSNTIIQVMKIDGTQYELLFSGFAWPSSLFCLFGGIFIDKVSGLRVGFMFAICVSIIGQCLLVTGAFANNFTIMLLSRYVLGIGNELQLIVMPTYIVLYFGGKEIAFAMSMSLSAARTAGGTALIVMQYLYEYFNFIVNPNYRLGVTLMIGLLLTMGSLVFGGLIVILDYKSSLSNLPTETNTYSKEPAVKNQHIRYFIQEIKALISLDFWLAITTMGIYVPIVFAFTSMGQRYFMQKYNFSIHEASFANSVVFFGVASITPLFGIIVSSTGFMLSWAQFGVVLAFLSHSLYVLTNVDNHASVFIAGMIFSVSYALVVIVAFSLPGQLVSKGQLSTAFGLLKSTQNVSYVVTCLITGILVDFAGYIFMELYYLILILLVFSMYLLLMARNKKLNASHIKCRQTISDSSFAEDSYSYKDLR